MNDLEYTLGVLETALRRYLEGADDRLEYVQVACRKALATIRQEEEQRQDTSDWEEVLSAIRADMRRQRYWSPVWSMSDHGDISNISDEAYDE